MPKMMTDKWDDAEDEIKEALNPFLNTYAWDVLLAMLERRGIRKALVDRRRELGLTQKDLAERMDVSQSWISEFETKPWPDFRLSTLRRWCMALDMVPHVSIVENPDYEDPDK